MLINESRPQTLPSQERRRGATLGAQIPALRLNGTLHMWKRPIFSAPMSSGTLRRAGEIVDGGARLGWNCKREKYVCRDGREIGVPQRTANVRDLDETKTVPRNTIRYMAGKSELRIMVSNADYDRDMETLSGGSDGIRTAIFPTTVRTVRRRSFHNIASLRSAILNGGLEVLGTSEQKPNGERYSGVFEGSGLERVVFPSTLKRIEFSAFCGCARLKNINLPEGLEHIGMSSFSGTGIEYVEFPASLRTIEQCAFCLCKSLKYSKFDEGLEILGTDRYPPKGENFS